MTGCSFGFLLGCFIDNEAAAVAVNQLFVILFNFGSGCFTNLTTANWLVTFLGYISPFRYSTELVLRFLLDQKDFGEQTLEFFGYTYGEKICFIVLVGETLLFFLTAWITLVIKSKLM
jgi:hypothetical protein